MEVSARKNRAAVRAKRMARSLNAEALVATHQDLLSSLTPAQEASLRATFDDFAGSKGFLMPKDLSNALTSLADDITDDELHNVLELIGSSRMGFDEFVVGVVWRRGGAGESCKGLKKGALLRYRRWSWACAQSSATQLRI